MKKLILTALTAISVLATIVVVRAAMHRPQDLVGIERVTVDVNESAAARHLSEAIQLRTISHQRKADFDASQFEAFVSWVRNTYPEVDGAMQLRLLGDYTMLYRWAGSDPSLKPVLITGHYDVVPVIPGSESLWEHDPFGGEIADGVIWGRGALDDKSGVIAQLEAAAHLIRAGHQPERTIYFSFGHDEEIGGINGAGRVADLLAEQNIQLAWSLDEGSFLFDDMVPGVTELMAAVNVAEKGSVTLQIVAHGAGGHSSVPTQQTAVGLLADAISKLEANPIPGGLSGLSAQMFDTISRYMPFRNRVFFANQWLFGGLIDAQLSSLPFGNAMLRTTTAPTMLSGSIKANVLPIEAIATVNFRIHPRDTVDSVVAHVKSIVENDEVEVRVSPGSGRGASAVSSWESEGFGLLKQAINEVYGPVVVAPGLMVAASDTRHYGRVADNAFRFNPMTVSQADLAGFHGTNERISVQNLAQGIRTYVRIIALATDSG